MADSETTAEDFFRSYGLRVQRFTKSERRAGKTPDFKVFRGDNFVFYSEVKNAEKDSWLDKQWEHAGNSKIVGGLRSDPVFNRLTTYIHKARTQFDAVNPDEVYPNVLTIHNEDPQVGFNDLLAVTTGNFYAESGDVHPIYRKYSHGRVTSDIDKIHLFVWLDEYKPFRLFFNLLNERHLPLLCREFATDASSIKKFYRDGA